MTECPDCKSKDVVSKGYREGNKAHRYICKACGRNFTVPIAQLPSKIQEEVDTRNAETKESLKLIKSLKITQDTYDWLESLKLVKQEPFDSVLRRLKEKHHA